MMPILSPREKQTSPRNQVRLKNQDFLTFADEQIVDNQPFSLNKKLIKISNKNSKNSNVQNFLEKFISSDVQERVDRQRFEQPSITLSQLTKKLQKVSFKVLKAQYDSQFSQNSEYFSDFSQLNQQTSIDKLLHFYTTLLLTIIQTQERNRINSELKFKTINISKTQRIKLKLILNRQEEDEIYKFKNKGLDTYVKKIQDEAEKHKRESIMIKQRNRILQNELLKLALQFKSKRELYIAEITRLTQILHSSFMEVGKMFVHVPNQNTLIYPPGLLTKSDNKVIPAIPKQSKQPSVTPQYTRKNVKSLSPTRKFEDYDYVKQEDKTPKFFKPHVKVNSNDRNYGSSHKPDSVENGQNRAESLKRQIRINRQFDAESQPAILQKRNFGKKPQNLMFSAVNQPRPKDSIQ